MKCYFRTCCVCKGRVSYPTFLANYETQCPKIISEISIKTMQSDRVFTGIRLAYTKGEQAREYKTLVICRSCMSSYTLFPQMLEQLIESLDLW